MAARKEAEARWRELLEAQESSGESVRDFARRRGLSATTLYWWRSELRRRDRRRRASSERIELAPVALLEADRPTGSRGGSFEVVLGNGRRVIVPSDFDAGALGHLVAALERPC